MKKNSFLLTRGLLASFVACHLASAEPSRPWEQPTAGIIAKAYTITSSGIADNKRRLLFARCLYGQRLQGQKCTGAAEKLTVTEITAPETKAHLAPWRLPTEDELHGLLAYYGERDDGPYPQQIDLFTGSPSLSSPERLRMITYGWGRSQASDKLINMNSDSLRIPTGYAILVREMSAADEASSSASFTGRKPDLAAAMGEFGAASATRSVEPPRTPIGALARKAGALLGAAETVRVYKQTDCAYALPRSFPSADQLWRDEIFPAIPAGHKDEFSKLLESLRPLLKRQADTMVAESFRSVSGKLDRKTVCGLVGGVLATVFGRATDEFQEQKMAFAAGKVRP